MSKKQLEKDTEIQHIEERQEIDSNVMVDTATGMADTIDDAAERRLRWKIDFYVIPTAAMLYFLCFIDRVNIGTSISHTAKCILILAGNASLAGLDKSLGLVGFDYNILLSVFYVSYILFEIPMNWLCKLMGPG